MSNLIKRLRTPVGFQDLPFIQVEAADEIAALQARAETAEARLATVLQLVTHAATELAQSAQDMSAIRAERALHKAIRALADDPETIDRIVAQVKEGRG